MDHILVRKLEGLAPLSERDRRAVAELCIEVRLLKAGEDLIREGERPERVFLLLEGWACRYKLLPNGGRQILAYLIPGDLCDIHNVMLDAMDHGICLLSDARVVAIAHDRITAIMDRHPHIARALWWATLVDEAVLREWLVNLAQREPVERIGHLLCEMRTRMRAVGLAGDGAFNLPLTQAEMGDTMGLTPVTVNRVLQRLRGEGLITLEQKRLTLHDPDRLATQSGFTPNYLHLAH